MIRKGRSSVPIHLLISVLLACCIVISGCSGNSFLTCSVPESGIAGLNPALSSLKLKALSPAAKRGQISFDSTTAWFIFEPEEFSAVISRDPLLDALEVTVTSSVPVDVMFAPVFTNDLTGRGKLVQNPASRSNAMVSGVSGKVTIRMSMIDSGNQDTVTGFAVEARLPENSGKTGTELDDNKPYAGITSISLVRSEIGWETGSDGYWAGFGHDGGICTYREKTSVPINRGEQATFTFYAAGDDIGTPVRSRRSVFSAGSLSFGWRASPDIHTAHLYAEQLEGLPVLITPVTGTEHLSGIRITPASIMQTGSNVPIPLDPHAMVTWPQHRWRNNEREIFSWDRFPSILIFDTADYSVQARYFKRLAFFVEKAGYVGRLMHDRDIAHLHGYNAHDYRAENLADFFNQAVREKFTLNRHELELRDILLENGIIIAGDGGYLPGNGAVLSLSRESISYLRYLFMAHEGFHGLYFTDVSFRNEMHRLYTGMDWRAIDFLETYFSIVDSLGYDRSDRFLMENECMAYTLQQPVKRVADYFSGTIRERFTRYGGPDDIAEYIKQSSAEDFVILAKNLETYVFSRWGLSAGRVGLWYSNRD